MIELRNTATHLQLIAHAILDDVRAGLFHYPKKINWALRILGEKA